MSMFFLVYGSHIEQAYSSIGLARVLYEVSFSLVASVRKFFLRKSRVLFALEKMFTYSFRLRF